MSNAVVFDMGKALVQAQQRADAIVDHQTHKRMHEHPDPVGSVCYAVYGSLTDLRSFARFETSPEAIRRLRSAVEDARATLDQIAGLLERKA